MILAPKPSAEAPSQMQVKHTFLHMEDQDDLFLDDVAPFRRQQSQSVPISQATARSTQAGPGNPRQSLHALLAMHDKLPVPPAAEGSLCDEEEKNEGNSSSEPEGEPSGSPNQANALDRFPKHQTFLVDMDRQANSYSSFFDHGSCRQEGNGSALPCAPWLERAPSPARSLQSNHFSDDSSINHVGATHSNSGILCSGVRVHSQAAGHATPVEVAGEAVQPKKRVNRRKARSLITLAQQAQARRFREQEAPKATTTRKAMVFKSSPQQQGEKMMVKFCPQCGGELQTHYRFCKFCGTSIPWEFSQARLG